MSTHDRVALVTGGATVVFQELIDEALQPNFLAALQRNGFKKLVVQSGPYHETVLKKLRALHDAQAAKEGGIDVESFPFDADLKGRMKTLRGQAGRQSAGVVISHAGTGTIADALEVRVAQIIVANPSLMDNHQAEFATAMAHDNPTIVQGHLGALQDAIPEIIDAIRANGLDDLEYPYPEPDFPVRDEDRLTFIDQLITMDY